MKQAVKVHSVEEDGVIMVHYPSPNSEKSNTSRSFWGVKEKLFPASNNKNLEIHKGDMVEILIDPSGAIKAAFMIFIFPLLCFLLVYVSAARLIDSELVLFVLGTAGFATGFLINILIRKLKGPGDMPEVLKILSHAEIMKWKSCNAACESCKGCG